jgi:hypothetical protein
MGTAIHLPPLQDHEACNRGKLYLTFICKTYKHIYIYTHRHTDIKHCALLRYYGACSDNSLPTFRHNLSVPYSKAKSLRVSRIQNLFDTLPLNIGPIDCPETSEGVTTTRCVIVQKSSFLIYFPLEAWSLACIYFLISKINYFLKSAEIWISNIAEVFQL